VRGPKITGAAGSRSAADPVIHCLSPWMLLITTPEAVKGRCLRSVLPGMEVGGAAGPLGATGPPPCHGMNRLCSRMPSIALQ
jgi:hypothetical protein